MSFKNRLRRILASEGLLPKQAAAPRGKAQVAIMEEIKGWPVGHRMNLSDVTSSPSFRMIHFAKAMSAAAALAKKGLLEWDGVAITKTASTKAAGRQMPRLDWMIPTAEKGGAREEKMADGMLRVWRWSEDHVNRRTGKPITRYYLLMGSASKRAKNALEWSYYTSESSRDSTMDSWVSSYERRAAEKARKREEAKNFMHGLKVGDILYASWGYDQTNVNFYQVTKVIGKATVEVREVQSKVVREDGYSVYVTALKGKWLRGSAPMKRRVSTQGSIKINSSIRAYPWDGKPKYETSPYAGH